MLDGAQALLLRLSLHRRIAVFVSGILLAVFVAFGYVGWEAVNRSTEATLSERHSTALIVAHQLDDLIGHALGHLSVTAQRAIEESAHLERAEVARALEASLPQERFFFSSLLAFDATGRFIASAPSMPSVNLDGEAKVVLDGTLRSGNPAVSDLLTLPAGGAYGVLFVAPMVRNGLVSGAIVGEMHLPHPSIYTVAKSLRSGLTGHMEVLDGRGRVIASTMHDEVGRRTEHPDYYDPLLATRASAVGSAPGGWGHRENEVHVMAFAPLSLASWGVGLGQEDIETFAASRDQRDRTLVVAALALIAALGAAWAGTRSVVRPIRALTRAGERMATGNLSEPIDVTQPDEVGRLALVLEGMRQRLDQSLAEVRALNCELEERVSARTHDLETANRHLQALMAVATAASSRVESYEVLATALDELRETLGLQGAWALLWNEEKRHLRLVTDGREAESLRKVELPAGVPEPACLAVQQPRTSCHEAGPSCAVLPDDLKRLVDGAVCWCMPIETEAECFGTLCLSIPTARTLGTDETSLVQGIAQELAVAFEKARLTEQRARLEAAQRLELLRAEFLASVSHELRTPLGFIKGYATTLLREDVRWDAAHRLEFLSIIDEECDRLTSLVDSLLDVARTHTGRRRLECQPVQLHQVLRHSLDRMGATLAEHDVTLHMDVAPTIVADGSRLEQVVVNLLQNAVKYSPNGGRIEVWLTVGQEDVRISVLDRGLGMPPAAVQKIFEPFYRVPIGPTAGLGGAGLGLTICRAIVEAHGGRIWAELRPEGGTAMHVALPLQVSSSGEVYDGQEVRAGG